ncbi:cysteine--tRNA ligase [Candidatus Steffania adelgidicola]|uniref:cysteine--tRNA ligase n=1 Tax=Candidatus Steffania adelgidicola TaxID=1076626 RepID=UPI001D02F675|nr:cysteine--tRNA ligase [Candidatus Steffania adelgidicola]UDG80186.1 Cysteine--tRNA ligase [Candidatus Steffania adelgidicola]
MLKIFNTLTHQKEEFKPIKAGHVSIYVCGISVYDLCHIGHARTFIIFDVITRYLRYRGFKVKYVRNITDIEDKIIQRASENNESFQYLSNRMIKEMHRDLDQLHILRPDYEPRATHYMDEIIKLIDQLIKRKHAYISSSGDVMFSIESASDYGRLSRQNPKKLQESTRVTRENGKQNSMDFVLWKMSKPGEPSWPSSWGVGRPGWHIECSAMNNRVLGHHFDIHGGGSDLIFPHHENEIAQSTCAYGSPYVNVWIHAGMVMCNREKISKSLDNFFTIRDLLRNYDAETLRYFLMCGHYRSQLTYNEDNLQQAQTALERLYIALRDTDKTAAPSGGEEFSSRFIIAMDDDFNTPEAYSVLFSLAHEVNRMKSKDMREAQGMAATLRHLGNILGLLHQDSIAFLQKRYIDDLDNHEEISSLIQQRNSARQSQQWEKADYAREKLNALGIVLEDNTQGTFWRRSQK